MIHWFRDRLKNQRPWFRVDSGVDSIEGFKHKDGTLELRVKILGQESLVKLNRESADKLSGWMSRTYPNRGNNVIQMVPKLSVLTTPTDPS